MQSVPGKIPNSIFSELSEYKMEFIRNIEFCDLWIGLLYRENNKLRISYYKTYSNNLNKPGNRVTVIVASNKVEDPFFS